MVGVHRLAAQAQLDEALRMGKEGRDASAESISDKSESQSFKNDRMAFGRRLRLAMAIIGADDSEAKAKELAALEGENSGDEQEHRGPLSVEDLARQLRALHEDSHGQLCRRIELLVAFDERKGWRETGAKHCIQWMGSELSIGPALAFEQLRVGRQLRKLPILRALFRRGRLGWCKIRLLTRVADASNEELLSSAALEATVTDVQRLCDEYRWQVSEDEDEASGGESARARALFERRSFSWRRLPDTNTEIKLVLPAELAQNVLKSVEHCEDMLFSKDQESAANVCSKSADQSESAEPVKPVARQRRADAAVMMAERSLAFAGSDILRADRYQVIVTVDADALMDDETIDDSTADALMNNEDADEGADAQIDDSDTDEDATGREVDQSADATSAAADTVQVADTVQKGSGVRPTVDEKSCVPPRKPVVEGAGPIARNTALKLLCDCRTSGIVKFQGEPISIGRKTRIWPAPMRQAIIERDRHCQFPGCDASRHLVIHHIRHWAHGGETSVDNGICLCQSHHTLIHDQSYRIRRKCSAERRYDFETAHFRKDDGTRDVTHDEDYWEFTLRSRVSNAEGVETLMKTRNRFNFDRGCSGQNQNANHNYVKERAAPIYAVTGADEPVLPGCAVIRDYTSMSKFNLSTRVDYGGFVYHQKFRLGLRPPLRAHC